MAIQPNAHERILRRFVVLVCVAVLSSCAWPPAPPARSSNADAIAGLEPITRAMLSNDVNARLAVVRLSVAGCTTHDGLGGPPKCANGESDGTPIEYLPVLGPGEGSTVRRADVPNVMGTTVSDVLGIYRVRPDATREPEYPAGEYAIIFRRPTDSPITVRVSGGKIVRLDVVMDAATAFAADGEQWLVAPAPQVAR